MADIPMLFSDPMVLAILAGTKTQTRRIVKDPKWAVPGTLQLGADGEVYAMSAKTGCMLEVPCPYGGPGDRLWVREAFADPCYRTTDQESETVIYRAGHEESTAKGPRVDIRWKPSIHMPRWACRIERPIVSVRAMLLQSINDADATAEGVDLWAEGALSPDGQKNLSPTEKFRWLWSSINGEESWFKDPLVWAVGFEGVPHDAR